MRSGRRVRRNSINCLMPSLLRRTQGSALYVSQRLDGRHGRLTQWLRRRGVTASGRWEVQAS